MDEQKPNGLECRLDEIQAVLIDVSNRLSEIERRARVPPGPRRDPSCYPVPKMVNRRSSVFQKVLRLLQRII